MTSTLVSICQSFIETADELMMDDDDTVNTFRRDKYLSRDETSHQSISLLLEANISYVCGRETKKITTNRSSSKRYSTATESKEMES